MESHVCSANGLPSNDYDDDDDVDNDDYFRHLWNSLYCPTVPKNVHVFCKKRFYKTVRLNSSKY